MPAPRDETRDELRDELRPPSSSPARQAHLREANLVLALDRIARAASPISRAGISAETGLTRATSSSLVDILIAAGLVRETRRSARGGVGRPATGLELDPQGPAGLGLELNVDYAAVCIVDFSGAVRHLEVVEGDFRDTGPAEVFRRLADLAQDARDATGLGLHAATLAIPGLVRAPYGPLQLAPNLGWSDLDVLALAHEQPLLSTLELTVDNDGNLAALAEMSESGHVDALLISGEIGVGGGIVLDGRLFRGRHGWSGELGHVAVVPDGPQCKCGARGCLEQFAGHDAIRRAAGVPMSPGTSLGGTPTASHLLALAEEGDGATLAALERAGWALGVAVSGALNLLDIDLVKLAGIYRDLAPWIAPALEREIAERVLAAPWSRPTVVPARVGAEAAVLGAARSVVDRVRSNPARWVAG
ncbi:ROK family protein [Motilibacter peucedani]|uniref:ROK family protein n=1 Tax=Motilibacter peucedani TaxID=598650 RepID=UPI000EB5213D|nr:ROK family protein [Motilibacter peucedani]